MKTLTQLVISSRPLSWVNTAFPFAISYFLITREVDLTLIIGTVFFLIPYNLAMYGINDVFDYESDMRNPRKGGVEGAVLDKSMHTITLWAAFVSCVPFVVYLVAVGSIPATLVLALSLFAVVAYSLKGLRFKEIPVLDSITSSTHFVSPALYAVVLSGIAWTAPLVLMLLAFFVWGMASHAFGAIQDIQADKEAGLHSVATRFGACATARATIVAFVLSGLLILAGGFFVNPAWPYWVASLVALPYIVMAWPYRNLSDEDCEKANRGWRKFLVLNFVAGLVVSLILLSPYAWPTS